MSSYYDSKCGRPDKTRFKHVTEQQSEFIKLPREEVGDKEKHSKEKEKKGTKL